MRPPPRQYVRDLNFLGVDVRETVFARCAARAPANLRSYPRTRRPATYRGSWRSGATPWRCDAAPSPASSPDPHWKNQE